MADLTKLARALEAFPLLCKAFNTDQLLLFIDLCCHLRPELDLEPSSNRAIPPLHLPDRLQTFLALSILSLNTKDTIIVICVAWKALSRIIWETPMRVAQPSTLPLFLEYGTPLVISWKTIGPPVADCIYSECPKYGRPLINRKSYEATLFTKNEGPLPIFPSHLYCKECKTTYHTNYYIHSDASTRTYYNNVDPGIIQLSQRLFMEVTVAEMFAVMMTMSWTSATNCARIYNMSLGDYTRERQNKIQWKGIQMEMEHVWNSFFLHALILDAVRSGTRLSLPNSDIHHTERYAAALSIRNEMYKGAGRPFWNHICDSCSKVVIRNGVPVLIRAAVVDGVTIGHPCCAIHDCKESLPAKNTTNGKPRYCTTHQHLESKCATVSCDLPAIYPFKTCASPNCRKLEQSYKATGSSMFQLKARLARTRERLTGKKTLAPFQGAVADAIAPVTDVNIALDEMEDDDEVEVEMEMEEECKEKNRDKRRKLKARFGCNRTNNDELCVYPCGIVAGRTEMFGSEAPNGVRMFLNNLFPTMESLPAYIFHDNNCQVRKMLEHSFPDDPLLQIALPVDVFHFTCKHKESDDYCATHCNPAGYPELMENGKWVFNSSAAEQANAWIGGFLSIVRQMRAERYNFFLDEMIRRRNEWLFEELEQKGKNPRFLDYGVLLGSLIDQD